MPYSEDTKHNNEVQADFVNFVGQYMSMADYITPYQAQSTSGDMLVTVSRLVQGVCPQCIYEEADIWWSTEDCVRQVGKDLAKFRKASQDYQVQHPVTYEEFPAWNTIGGGWMAGFTTPDIPKTPETYGIIHGDLHQGNMMIDPDNHFELSILDLDNAEKNWFIVDLGTVVFELNNQLYSTLKL